MDGCRRGRRAAGLPSGTRSIAATASCRRWAVCHRCRDFHHGHPATPQARTPAGRYSIVTGRIAVIDDEAPNRAYLQTLLGTAGFDVQAAADGNEGVALVEKERPDLVLVDLMMPGVDGFVVCERIRNGPAGADVQIVVLSVLDELDGKVRAAELGADDYLVKPVDARRAPIGSRTTSCETRRCRSGCCPACAATPRTATSLQPRSATSPPPYVGWRKPSSSISGTNRRRSHRRCCARPTSSWSSSNRKSSAWSSPGSSSSDSTRPAF